MKILEFLKRNLFSIISWFVTILIVAGIVGGGLWYKGTTSVAALVPVPTAEPDEAQPLVAPPIPGSGGEIESGFQSISRNIQLKTNMPERPRYIVDKYTVARGDSVFAIAEKYNVTPETLLWANYDSLQDNPHNLKPGITLNVPPTDGIYYQWKDGDTLESVANEFKADVEEILGWPGNDIDLTNPTVDPGSWVMVPDGEREFVQWLIPTIASGSSGTSGASGSSCPGGAVGSGAFVWPADNHFLSGNDYWSGHLAIDIAAGEGAPVYAADSGVVTMAQGGDNYGYGNVIQIDHGNGYATLYAHLSVIGVGVCQSVYAGQWIGGAGNTGNSQGAHLHFEVRQGGGFINPWFVLP
ncbi:MAG: peptidoglycan DD-metalloendopeptidase family protein [Anaerolineales bacterium]|nr:peptidoglycan DD-metalloendopeptidase family protein [Anaerolineales bacterium]